MRNNFPSCHVCALLTLLVLRPFSIVDLVMHACAPDYAFVERGARATTESNRQPHPSPFPHTIHRVPGRHTRTYSNRTNPRARLLLLLLRARKRKDARHRCHPDHPSPPSASPPLGLEHGRCLPPPLPLVVLPLCCQLLLTCTFWGKSRNSSCSEED